MLAGHTNRGFAIFEFEDRYGVKCSLQESSLATEGAVWFGPDEPNTRFLGSNGWEKFQYPPLRDLIHDTRAHITQQQMQELLPAFEHFAKTGYLPEVEDGIMMTTRNRWRLAVIEQTTGWHRIGWCAMAILLGGIAGSLHNLTGIF